MSSRTERAVFWGIVDVLVFLWLLDIAIRLTSYQWFLLLSGGVVIGGLLLAVVLKLDEKGVI